MRSPRRAARLRPALTRTPSGVFAGVLSSVVAALAVVCGLPAVSVAGEPGVANELSVSRDGFVWTDEIDQALFDPTIRLVPGAGVSASFWVRNNTRERGTLTIDLRLDATTGTFPVVLTATGGDQHAWRTHGTVQRTTLDAGHTEEVTVHVHLPASAGNRTQFDAGHIGLVVGLSGPRRGPTGGRPGPAGVPGGGLPNAGGPSAWIAAVGLGLLSVGLLLAAGKRRRTEERT